MAGKRDVAIYLKAVDRATKGFKSVSSSWRAESGKMRAAAKGLAIGIGAAGAGIMALAGTLTMAARRAAREEEVFELLRFQVESLGVSFDKVRPRINKLAKEIQELTRFGDDETAAVLQKLVAYNGDFEASMANVTTTMDLATAMHMDLNTAARYVGTALAGNVEMLGRYIPALRSASGNIKEGMTNAEKAAFAMKVLNERFGGAAQAQLNTYLGLWQKMLNYLGDLWEAIGHRVTPIFNRLFKTMTTRFKDAIEVIESGRLDYIFEGIGKMVVWVGDRIGDLFILAVRIPAYFGLALKAITRFFNTMRGSWQTAQDWVDRFAEFFVKQIWAAMKLAGNIILAVSGLIWQPLLLGFKQVWYGIIQVGNVAGAVLMKGLKEIINFWIQNINFLLKHVQWAVNQLGRILPEKYEFTLDAQIPMLETVSDFNDMVVRGLKVSEGQIQEFQEAWNNAGQEVRKGMAIMGYSFDEFIDQTKQNLQILKPILSTLITPEDLAALDKALEKATETVGAAAPMMQAIVPSKEQAKDRVDEISNMVLDAEYELAQQVDSLRVTEFEKEQRRIESLADTYNYYISFAMDLGAELFNMQEGGWQRVMAMLIRFAARTVAMYLQNRAMEKLQQADEAKTQAAWLRAHASRMAAYAAELTALAAIRFAMGDFVGAAKATAAAAAVGAKAIASMVESAAFEAQAVALQAESTALMTASVAVETAGEVAARGFEASARASQEAAREAEEKARTEERIRERILDLQDTEAARKYRLERELAEYREMGVSGALLQRLEGAETRAEGGGTPAATGATTIVYQDVTFSALLDTDNAEQMREWALRLAPYIEEAEAQFKAS